METIAIQINSSGPAETTVLKNAVQKIVTGFNKESLKKIAELSEKPDINAKLIQLLNNPLVKMKL